MAQIRLLKDEQMNTNLMESITSIHDLVEIVSEYLKNPVTIEAPNFDLIAYSGNSEVFDTARQSTILSKKVPQNIVNYFVKSGIVEKIEKSNDILTIKANDEIGLSNRVVCVIKNNNDVLGHIWVQETNKVVTAEEKLFLKQMSEVAAKMLVKNREQKKSESESKNLFYSKLFQGTYVSERNARLEGELIGIHIPSKYSLLMLQFTHGSINDKIRSYLRTYSLYTSKSTYWMESGNQIFIIVGSPSNIKNSSLKLAEHLLKKLSANLKDDEIKWSEGISNEYDQLLDLKKCYEEVTTIINLREQLNINIPNQYEQLGFYKLLTVIQSHYYQERYANEKLLKLLAYDINNQSDLIGTLKTYICCNCKGKETADTLYIHINTLNYRLKRISELCNLNLDDINERTLLYIDLLLMDKML